MGCGAGAGAGACAGAGAAGGAVAAALQFFVAAQCLLTEPWPPQPAVANASCFEFVVVGGGTAGATLAARLAERHSVLLLEAGPDPPPEAIIPMMSATLMGTEYDWQFTSEDDGYSSQALRGGRQAQPRGRMLGGSGSLNDMVYARGFPADYDEWARMLGDDTWKWEHVLPYFKKTEHLTDERIVNDPALMRLHGRGGDIEVSGLNESSFTTHAFLDAFEELGFKRVKDMTSPDEIGVGRQSHTIRAGRRDSSLTALLNKVVNKNNLFVLRNALVTKILIENSTAYGVLARLGGEELQFYATKEVILTAGTFNTPKLLMLSGIGPREHLEKWGIEVVQDLPVGENLHDHVMVLSYIAADNGTCYNEAGASHLATLRYLHDRGGVLARVDSAAAYMALNSTAHPPLPDFAFYPSCMPVNTDFYSRCVELLRLEPTACGRLQDVLRERELITVAVVLLKPESRGRVLLRSADPLATPLIYSGTFSAAGDLAGFPRALAVVHGLTNTAYFKRKNARLVELEVATCGAVVGPEYGRCYARALGMAAWHAAGTAALGGPLRARLHVRGVRALRVADASAMPRVPRGNTNAPVVMLAERAASFILEDHCS